MKKHLTRIILIFAVIIGVSLLLYPTVSDYINSLGHRREISDYISNVENLDNKTYQKILAAAKEYNEELSKKPLSLYLTDEERQVYENLLDITGTGMMGYIEIPSVNISLPIYHGSSEAVLQSGVGHMEGSSLPIGGKSTHSILSGHRGLPSSKLFTNIDKLEKGDTFTLKVLNEEYAYEVDQIMTVEPYELDSLNIEEGKDYCTLVTCTPYGVNTHRLLVRGHRTTTLEDVNNLQQKIFGIDVWLLIPIIFIPVLLLIIILLTLRYKKRKR